MKTLIIFLVSFMFLAVMTFAETNTGTDKHKKEFSQFHAPPLASIDMTVLVTLDYAEQVGMTYVYSNLFNQKQHLITNFSKNRGVYRDKNRHLLNKSEILLFKTNVNKEKRYNKVASGGLAGLHSIS